MTHAIVCGLGPSIEGFVPPERSNVVTWGVNDIGRHFTPDHLVVLDGPEKFQDHHTRPDALEIIVGTRSRYVWVSKRKFHGDEPQVKWSRRGPGTPATWGKWPDTSEMMQVILETLGKGKAIDFGCHKVPIYETTAFSAAFLAIHNGHSRVGILGVDLVGHPHLEGLAQNISYQFGRLAEAARSTYDIELVNLSPISKVTSLRRMGMDEFLDS